MFTLPNFCRVCLKYDKSLIDLEHIENEPSETLMSKLQQCVSEVEWTIFKPLLCHPCIKRLNVAYTFKKQCVQSATVLKNYVALVQETKQKKKNSGHDEQVAVVDEKGPPGSAYMMLPNQKYIKIVAFGGGGGGGGGAGSQNNTPNNSFQNVFLNVVPSSPNESSSPSSTPRRSKGGNKSTDTNQNVFSNINSTFHKYIPKEHEAREPKTVNSMLTESKSEELSVEIDPMIFDLDDEDYSDDENQGSNDWEEIISHSQFESKHSRSNGNASFGQNNSGGSIHDPKSQLVGSPNFAPVMPKAEDFFTGQHFLSSTAQCLPAEFLCELCQKPFISIKLLKMHIKESHGKTPFRCDYCCKEYMMKADCDACMRSHRAAAAEADAHNTSSLTLRDFKKFNEEKGAVSLLPSGPEHNLTPRETESMVCDICHRQFNSTSGLLRHKVRKHNQKSKKKYFVKGMKNARCDICNREFSTQSYMQLHRKLHLRDDVGYKYKVFGKNRYANNREAAVKTEKPKEEIIEIQTDPLQIDPLQNSESEEEYDDNRSIDNHSEEMMMEVEIIPRPSLKKSLASSAAKSLTIKKEPRNYSEADGGGEAVSEKK